MVLAREKLRKDCESLVKKETDIRLAIDDLKKKSLELRQQIQQTRTKVSMPFFFFTNLLHFFYYLLFIDSLSFWP